MSFVTPAPASRILSQCSDGPRIGSSARGHAMRATLSVILAVSVASNFALCSDLSGRASVIDGDTLEIHGTRVRLWGIDAPESDQVCRGEDSLQYRCGTAAANKLDAFISGRPVHCSPKGLDRYGRMVASCDVGGDDLGEWLVTNGLALDWPRYSNGRYAAQQRAAEHGSAGMWAGSFVEPWNYRACVRPSGRPATCSDDANAHP